MKIEVKPSRLEAEELARNILESLRAPKKKSGKASSTLTEGLRIVEIVDAAIQDAFNAGVVFGRQNTGFRSSGFFSERNTYRAIEGASDKTSTSESSSSSGEDW